MQSIACGASYLIQLVLLNEAGFVLIQPIKELLCSL